MGTPPTILTVRPAPTTSSPLLGPSWSSPAATWTSPPPPARVLSAQETISGSMTRPECSDSRGPGTASLTAPPSPTPPTSRSSSRRTMTAPQGKVLTVKLSLRPFLPPQQQLPPLPPQPPHLQQRTA